MKNTNGLFITFEGPEASGKSSQIILLKKFLKKNKIPFLITREPGGTFIAEKLMEKEIEYFEITITDSFAVSKHSLFAKSEDNNGALIPGLPYQFIISEDDQHDGRIYLLDQAAISNSFGFAYDSLYILPSLFFGGSDTIELPISVSIPSTDNFEAS